MKIDLDTATLTVSWSEDVWCGSCGCWSKECDVDCPVFQIIAEAFANQSNPI